MRHRHVQIACSLLIIALAPLLLEPAATSARDFAPPYEPGPFNVGVTTFPAVMSGGRATLIQVFYPTLDDFDEDSTYTILTAVGSYQLRSPLGAVHDAQAASGLFPLVV